MTSDVVEALPTAAVFVSGAPLDLAAGPETERHVRLRAAEELVGVVELRLRTLNKQRDRLAAEMELRSGDPTWSGEDVDAAARRLAMVERRILKAQARLTAAQADADALLNGGPIAGE